MRAIVLTLACLTPGCFNGLLVTPARVGGPVSETVVASADSYFVRDKIALIDVHGMILNARGSSLLGAGDNPVSLFHERLEAAAQDDRVKAVVLRLNSPGGTVTASEIMYQDVIRFREKTGKPVVACMMDVAASGAYYLAMACDRVYAHPTTVTGSIGVIMNLYNASGLFGKLGIASDPIKSGPNKDIGNPGRPMTDAERAIMQGMVDSFYGQFVQVVSKGRKLSEEQVRVLADGRVYTGIEAKKVGLVDEVGYLDDAILAARNLANIKDAALVAYDRGDGFRGSIYAGLPQIPSEIHVKLDLLGLGTPGGAAFMYLWQPGASVVPVP